MVTGPGRTSRVELVFLTRLLIVASKGIQKFFHVDSRIVGFGIRNPRHRVHNPRLSWIHLHGAKTREEGWDNMYNSWFMKVGRSNFHCGNHKRYHLYHVISSDILIIIRYCGFKKMFERAQIAEFTL